LRCAVIENCSLATRPGASASPTSKMRTLLTVSKAFLGLCVYPRDRFARKSIQAGCSFMQGIAANDSPPASRNISLPSMAISSSVSRQSETKAGIMTRSRLVPFFARSGRTWSVNGSIQGSRPRRDWKEIEYWSSEIPARLTKAVVVAIT